MGVDPRQANVYACTLRRRIGYIDRVSTSRRAGSSPIRDAARTRSRILLEARRQFAREGYHATTVRGVAAAANVSPNLITRYFAGKEGLFLAATDVRLELARVLRGARESFGRRLADAMITRWETIDGEDPLLILLRAAGERREAAAVLASFLDRESVAPLVSQLQRYGLSREEAADRAAAIDVFVMGVVTRRRVLAQSLGDRDRLRDWLARAIQRLIDGT
jgi:AcrR family transcriptional regulator